MWRSGQRTLVLTTVLQKCQGKRELEGVYFAEKQIEIRSCNNYLKSLLKIFLWKKKLHGFQVFLHQNKIINSIFHNFLEASSYYPKHILAPQGLHNKSVCYTWKQQLSIMSWLSETCWEKARMWWSCWVWGFVPL